MKRFDKISTNLTVRLLAALCLIGGVFLGPVLGSQPATAQSAAVDTESSAAQPAEGDESTKASSLLEQLWQRYEARGQQGIEEMLTGLDAPQRATLFHELTKLKELAGDNYRGQVNPLATFIYKATEQLSTFILTASDPLHEQPFDSSDPLSNTTRQGSRTISKTTPTSGGGGGSATGGGGGGGSTSGGGGGGSSSGGGGGSTSASGSGGDIATGRGKTGGFIAAGGGGGLITGGTGSNNVSSDSNSQTDFGTGTSTYSPKLSEWNLDPMTADRIIHVSSVSGNDSNNGTQAAPVRTLAKAILLAPLSGHTAILLKRGEAFEPVGRMSQPGRGGLGGLSKQQPLIISVYGDSSLAPPLIEVGPQGSGFDWQEGSGFVAVVGINFYCPERNPDDARFVGTEALTNKRSFAILCRINNAESFLVYNCWSRFCEMDVTPLLGDAEERNFKDVQFINTIVLDTYAIGAHAQGLHVANAEGVYIEGCVFDHCGWYPAAGSGAERTKFNHGNYIAASSNHLIVRNSIFTNNSCTGLQARCGGIIENNFFFGNPVQFDYGRSQGKNASVPGGVSGHVTGNLIFGSVDGGQGISQYAALFEHTEQADVYNNVFMDLAKALVLSGIETEDRRPGLSVPLKNLSVHDNLLLSAHHMINIEYRSFVNVVVSNNKVAGDVRDRDRALPLGGITIKDNTRIPNVDLPAPTQQQMQDIRSGKLTAIELISMYREQLNLPPLPGAAPMAGAAVSAPVVDAVADDTPSPDSTELPDALAVTPVDGAIAPVGSGFAGATAQPEPIGAGIGESALPIAHWDLVPNQDIDGVFDAGLVAFQISGIDRVEFSVDGGDWTPVTAMTVNPRTGTGEYHVRFDTTALPQKPIELRAIVYPRVGLPRVMDAVRLNIHHDTPRTRWVASTGNDDTGDGSQAHPYRTIRRAAVSLATDNPVAATLDHGLIYLTPGQYALTTDSNLDPAGSTHDAWITIAAAPDLAADQVTLVNGPGATPPILGRVHLKGLTVEQTTLVGGSTPDSALWFDRCRLIGTGSDAGKAWAQTSTFAAGVFITDSTIESVQTAIDSARLARNVQMHQIGRTALLDTAAAISVCIDSLEPSFNDTADPAVVRIATLSEDVIVFGLIAVNCDAHAFHAPGADMLANVALVNTVTAGGPERASLWTRPTSHMLIWHVSVLDQPWVWARDASAVTAPVFSDLNVRESVFEQMVNESIFIPTATYQNGALYPGFDNNHFLIGPFFGTDATEGDPGFVDAAAGNFTLTATSPLLGRLVEPTVPLDIQWQPWPALAPIGPFASPATAPTATTVVPTLGD